MQKRVLVLQGDLVMRKILERMFHTKGYDCHCLASLAEFKDKDVQSHFHVVVTDLLFRGISPQEYVLKLNGSIKYDKLFVVTMLGQEKIKRSISRLTTIDGYFDYPVDLKEIEDKI
ncbi:response regulator [Flagellimonas halotolerans]|uniref:response regulator n=1 Tax=Flagellimonas halotolerans TaxID=3112164 RepID=UPI002DB92AB1|nr:MULTISPECIES: response regulator [unclassified Allomuricauda]MEC3967095.1 response regulator [Muricauda sp. SYSU M86414]